MMQCPDTGFPRASPEDVFSQRCGARLPQLVPSAQATQLTSESTCPLPLAPAARAIGLGPRLRLPARPLGGTASLKMVNVDQKVDLRLLPARAQHYN